jgi:hypothetical protein
MSEYNRVADCHDQVDVLAAPPELLLFLDSTSGESISRVLGVIRVVGCGDSSASIFRIEFASAAAEWRKATVDVAVAKERSRCLRLAKKRGTTVGKIVKGIKEGLDKP